MPGWASPLGVCRSRLALRANRAPACPPVAAAVAIQLRTRLTIDGSSVRVVNAFRSWTGETSEVAFFEQPSRSRFETNRLVSTMRLRNGETIRVYALSAPRLFPNGRVARNLHQTIAGLNAYVARHGGGPVAPVGRLQSVDPN